MSSDRRSDDTPPTPRLAAVVVRSAIMFAVLAGLAWAIYHAARQLAVHPLPWNEVRWGFVALAIPLCGLALLIGGVVWRLALGQLNQRVPWRGALRAFVVSQLGKYVPGKALVVIMRVGMVAPLGAKISAAIASCFIETLFWILVGAELACLTLLVFFPGQFGLQALALVCVMLGGLCAAPPILSTLTRLVNARLRPFAGQQPAVRFTWAFYGQAHVGFVTAWILQAAALWCVLSAMPGVEFAWRDGALALATVTTATIVGFLSMMPGGLGARELAIIPLLVPRLTLPQALTVAILMRCASIAAEVSLAAIMQRWKVGSASTRPTAPQPRDDP